MLQKKEKQYPDKVPGPEFKNEINWFYIFLLIVSHVPALIFVFSADKPLLTWTYGKANCRVKRNYPSKFIQSLLSLT